MNKKIGIVLIVIIVLVTIVAGMWLIFSKDNKGNDTNENKTKENTKQVKNGKMDTIEIDGFTIKLIDESGMGFISIKNTSAKKDTAYKISFIIKQKNENDTSSETTIPANRKEEIKIPTNIKINEIENIQYKVEKTTIISKGSPGKKTEK